MTKTAMRTGPSIVMVGSLLLTVALVPSPAVAVTTLVDQEFQTCTPGTNINGFQGWSGSAPDLNDLAVCDVAGWPANPLDQHLTVSGVGVPGAWAKKSFSSPTGAWDARAKLYAQENGLGATLNAWSLIELGGIAKVAFDDDDCSIDVTNGSSLATTCTTWAADPLSRASSS